VAIALDQEIVRRFPEQPGSRLRRAERSLRASRPDAALTELAPLVESGADPRIHALAGRAHLLAGHPDRAVAIARRGEARFGQRQELIEVLAEAEARRGNAGAMRAAVERLRELNAGRPAGIASVLALRGRLELELGNRAQAYSSFQDAHRIDPAPSRLVDLARAAEQAGYIQRAIQAYDELCGTHPDPQRFCAEGQRLRSGAEP
jgi:tetratricopeptide (TPR) repeat protein